MAQILFKNCHLLDNKNQTLQPGYWVLINDNLIQEVSQKEIIAEGATIIDLKNKTLMPGLIDAHVHVTATDLDLANDYIPDSEITVQAARFMEDMLMRGFTSIRDAGGADIGLSNAVKKALIKGPRLFYSGKAISQTGGHGDFRKATSKESIFDCTCADADPLYC
ncbi:MAG: amidohydrolase family protein [Gammaproteobacteria bacterium]|nr:amidohydrolase family protein [Gammaproteobacteria bacterium]